MARGLSDRLSFSDRYTFICRLRSSVMAKAIRHSSVSSSARYAFSSSGIGVAELQPLLDVPGGLAEAFGDLLGVSPAIDQPGEGFELVRRVHRQPDRVFGQAHLEGVVVGARPGRARRNRPAACLPPARLATPPGGGRRR